MCKKEQAKDMTEFNKTTFVDMNDDCIAEVLRRLPILDLAAMVEVNKRTSAIANDVFKRLRASNLFTFEMPNAGDIKAAKYLVDITSAFGEHLENIAIFGCKTHKSCISKKTMLSIIEKNCGPSLKKLCLEKMHIDSATLTYLPKILQNVRHVKVVKCSREKNLNADDELIARCPILRFLKSSTLHSLEYATEDPAAVKTISIILYGDTKAEELLPYYELKNLKKVFVHDFRELWEIYLEFGHTIFFGYSDDEVDKVLKNFVDNICENNNLDSFGIFSNHFGRDVCKAIARMTNIKDLKLVTGRGEAAHIVDILCSGLVNLETLFLYGFFENMAHNFVEKLPKLQSLYIKTLRSIEEIFFPERCGRKFIEARKTAIKSSECN